MQPKLIIKKRLIQATMHQLKPSVNAIARLPVEVRKIMHDSFGHETLFKKTIMIGARPGRAGDNKNSAFETKILDAFFKRDESLEITVSSLMIGQTYVGDSIWDALGFELVTKRAFDTMLVLLQTINEFDEERIYLGADKKEVVTKPSDNTRPAAKNSLASRTHRSQAVKAVKALKADLRERQDATAHTPKAQMDEIAT